MKATFDNQNMTVALDNDAVKAIRFVQGYTTDLRVSLTGIDTDKLWLWIDQNLSGILGNIVYAENLDVLSVDPARDGEKYDRYERMLNGIVRQIVR